jgi:hypothetical protein
MFKVKQLLAQTKSHRSKLFSNATRVSISFNQANYKKDGRGYFKSVTGSALTNLPGKKTKKWEIRLYYPKKSNYIPPKLRRGFQAYLGPEQPPPFTIDSDAWVSCSCKYFLFHCEYADTKKQSSSIKYSNGQAPVKTNPGQIGHICKHLIAAIKKGALVKK